LTPNETKLSDGHGCDIIDVETATDILILKLLSEFVKFLNKPICSIHKMSLNHVPCRLTRIRLHFAIYFLAFPGRSAQKAA
jgi:hypothetical protein